MTRAVYTVNLASFVVVVVVIEEVWARLCFEVPVTPPQSPLHTYQTARLAHTVYFLQTFSTQPASEKPGC